MFYVPHTGLTFLKICVTFWRNVTNDQWLFIQQKEKFSFPARRYLLAGDTDPVPLEALNYSVLAACPTLGPGISQGTRPVFSDIPGVARRDPAGSNLVQGSTTTLLPAFIHHWAGPHLVSCRELEMSSSGNVLTSHLHQINTFYWRVKVAVATVHLTGWPGSPLREAAGFWAGNGAPTIEILLCWHLDTK